MMRSVCHLTTAHPVFDDRIFYKECISLHSAGYSVKLIVKHAKNEFVNGIEIIALKERKYRFSRIFFNTFIALFKALKTQSCIFHLHDPELILAGIVLKLFRKKVIFDFHELVYYQMENKEWLGSIGLRKIVASTYLLIERLAVKVFDRLIMAEDGYIPYFKEQYPNQFKKFTLVRNYCIVALIDAVNPTKRNSDESSVIYAGALSRERGIKELILAIEKVEHTPLVYIYGRWDDNEYRRECESLPGWKQVIYCGFKRLEEVYAGIKRADIGISMLYPIRNYTNSMPVKSFEYLACGIPMVMSDFPLWVERFRDCALFANPYNPVEIAEKISYLLEHQDVRLQLAKNGRELTISSYSWEVEQYQLINLYNSLNEH